MQQSGRSSRSHAPPVDIRGGGGERWSGRQPICAAQLQRAQSSPTLVPSPLPTPPASLPASAANGVPTREAARRNARAGGIDQSPPPCLCARQGAPAARGGQQQQKQQQQVQRPDAHAGGEGAVGGQRQVRSREPRAGGGGALRPPRTSRARGGGCSQGRGAGGGDVNAVTQVLELWRCSHACSCFDYGDEMLAVGHSSTPPFGSQNNATHAPAATRTLPPSAWRVPCT